MSNATKTAKRSDFKKYFQFMWRSLNIQASWNYERQMNMGFLYGIAPTLDELYPDENDPEQLAHKKEAYEREELGIEMAKGMQTDHQVAATSKHYIAYSNNKGGREGMARVGSLWSLAKVPPRLPLSALPARSILLMDNGPCRRWSAKAKPVPRTAHGS